MYNDKGKRVIVMKMYKNILNKTYLGSFHDDTHWYIHIFYANNDRYV